MSNQKIKENFSKKAKYYDLNADIQKIMAEKLFNHIEKENYNNNNILEIGCGTGNLTQYLCKLNPNNLILNDISALMLEEIKKKVTNNKTNIEYICQDFIDIKSELQFGLICSNATFQWIADLELLFDKIYSMMYPNGLLFFSIFVKDTFHELDTAFCETYIKKILPVKKHTINFFSPEEVEKNLKSKKLSPIKMLIEDYVLKYPTPIDFLRSVHDIGAVTVNSERVSLTIMRNMLKEYEKLFSGDDGKITATYKVLYCVAKKCNK